MRIRMAHMEKAPYKGLPEKAPKRPTFADHFFRNENHPEWAFRRAQAAALLVTAGAEFAGSNEVALSAVIVAVGLEVLRHRDERKREKENEKPPRCAPRTTTKYAAR